MLTEKDIALFNDSLERSEKNGLFARFYSHFTATSDEVAARFSHTDMKKQERILKTSLYLMMLAREDKPEGNLHMQRLAMRHGRRELDIRPEWYEVWLDCLIAALREADPEFNPQTEYVWRAMMRPGIEYMQRHYED